MTLSSHSARNLPPTDHSLSSSFGVGLRLIGIKEYDNPNPVRDGAGANVASLHVQGRQHFQKVPPSAGLFSSLANTGYRGNYAVGIDFVGNPAVTCVTDGNAAANRQSTEPAGFVFISGSLGIIAYVQRNMGLL